jgi:hypothetical protein
MSRWVAHNGTYRCPDHPKLTVRAKRFRAFEGTAPRCGICQKPMKLEDKP